MIDFRSVLNLDFMQYLVYRPDLVEQMDSEATRAWVVQKGRRPPSYRRQAWSLEKLLWYCPEKLAQTQDLGSRTVSYDCRCGGWGWKIGFALLGSPVGRRVGTRIQILRLRFCISARPLLIVGD